MHCAVIQRSQHRDSPPDVVFSSVSCADEVEGFEQLLKTAAQLCNSSGSVFSANSVVTILAIVSVISINVKLVTSRMPASWFFYVILPAHLRCGKYNVVFASPAGTLTEHVTWNVYVSILYTRLTNQKIGSPAWNPEASLLWVLSTPCVDYWFNELLRMYFRFWWSWCTEIIFNLFQLWESLSENRLSSWGFGRRDLFTFTLTTCKASVEQCSVKSRDIFYKLKCFKRCSVSVVFCIRAYDWVSDAVPVLRFSVSIYEGPVFISSHLISCTHFRILIQIICRISLQAADCVLVRRRRSRFVKFIGYGSDVLNSFF